MCGGFGLGLETGIDDGLLALAGRARPRVLFVPTASGDSADVITRFYAAFARRSEASHVSLVRREIADLEALCRDQDLIYVGGGNTANMLAMWRVHGFDRALRAAYESGVVIAGVSAGAVCWFDDAVTDSFGMPMRRLGDGLGWLRGVLVPHYDREAQRRPVLARLVKDGVWSSALAIDDGAGLEYVDEQLTAVWSARDGAAAYRVERDDDGDVTEERLDVAPPPTRSA